MMKMNAYFLKNSFDASMAETSTRRDPGKSAVCQNQLSSGRAFKEHQLKQLRAQCIVSLAFKNGRIPKELHLEIALGSLLPKDGASSDGRKEMVQQQGNVQSSAELPGISRVPMASGRPNDAKEADGALPAAPSGRRLQDGATISSQDEQLELVGSKIGQLNMCNEAKNVHFD